MQQEVNDDLFNFTTRINTNRNSWISTTMTSAIDLILILAMSICPGDNFHCDISSGLNVLTTGRGLAQTFACHSRCVFNHQIKYKVRGDTVNHLNSTSMTSTRNVTDIHFITCPSVCEFSSLLLHQLPAIIIFIFILLKLMLTRDDGDDEHKDTLYAWPLECLSFNLPSTTIWTTFGKFGGNFILSLTRKTAFQGISLCPCDAKFSKWVQEQLLNQRNWPRIIGKKCFIDSLSGWQKFPRILE